MVKAALTLLCILFFPLPVVASQVYEVHIERHVSPGSFGVSRQGVVRKCSGKNRVHFSGGTYSGKDNGSKGLIYLFKGAGVRVVESGFMVVDGFKLNLRECPLLSAGGTVFVLDIYGRLDRVKTDGLKKLGIGVVRGRGGIRKVLDLALGSNYGDYDTNGTLQFGSRDIFLYRYDYLVYNTKTGSMKVFNLKADTPHDVEKLLALYNVELYQPRSAGMAGGWKKGRLVVLGEGVLLNRINRLIGVLIGTTGRITDGAVLFRKLHLIVSSSNADFKLVAGYKMKGYKVLDVSLSGLDFGFVSELLNAVGIRFEKDRFVVRGPGNRYKMVLPGMLVHAPSGDWLILEDVENPEELPCLVLAGINILVL